MVGHHLVTDGHDCLDAGGVAAVDDILAGEQMGGGYGHCAQFVEGKNREPELIAALQDEEHLVAASDADLLEERGRAVGSLLHL